MTDINLLDLSSVASWTQHTAGYAQVSLPQFKKHGPRRVLKFFLFSQDCRNLGSFLITQAGVVWGLYLWLLDIYSHQTKSQTISLPFTLHFPYELSKQYGQEEGQGSCNSGKWCLILI